MKTKGRRKSQNVEDVRSPAGNALVSRKNSEDYPETNGMFGPQVDLTPKEQYRANQAGKGITEAKGPFARMVGGMEDSARRFSREEAKKRVTGQKRSRMNTDTFAPDKNGKLRTTVRPPRRTKD